jgi:hypothetical protein
MQSNSLFFFILGLLCTICISTCNAQVTITFSDLNIQKGIKILIYNATGNLIGEYNTTDTVTLNTTQDYVFILKPTEQAWFSDPFQAIELFKASIPTMLSYLLFVVVIVSCGYLFVRIFR